MDFKNPFPQASKSQPIQTPAKPKAKGSPAETKPASKKEEKGIGEKITEAGKELWDWWESKGTATKDKQPTVQKPEGRSPAVMKEVKVEKKEEKKKGDCFCNRDITSEELMKLGISKKNTENFLDSINSTMKEYNINTCERKLHFLAQVRHESGEFIYQKEIASGAAYEERKDLGNTQPGDGKRFKGRGLIQITGRSNYTKYGSYKKLNFTTEPNNQKLEQLPYCTDSAGWYWSKCLLEDLNDYADKDDIIYVTYRINGGFNGYLGDRKPKLISMIKSIKCEHTKFENYDTYSIKTSKAWDKYDAVYKYAKLNTSESKDSYKRFLQLTDDYLTWPSIKKSKKKRLNMENKRKIAHEKSK